MSTIGSQTINNYNTPGPAYSGNAKKDISGSYKKSFEALMLTFAASKEPVSSSRTNEQIGRGENRRANAAHSLSRNDSGEGNGDDDKKPARTGHSSAVHGNGLQARKSSPLQCESGDNVTTTLTSKNEAREEGHNIDKSEAPDPPRNAEEVMDEVSNDSMQTMNASVFEPRTSQPLQPTRPPGEAEDAVAATLTAGTADLEEGADIDKSISPSPPIDVTGETDETLNGSPQVVVSDEAESDQTSVRHLTEHEAEPEIESVEETAHAPEKGQVDKAAVQSGNQSVQKDATAPDTLMDKTSPVSDGETSRHAIRSAVDSKAISPQEDVNGVSTSKPAAPEDVSVKATAPEPPGINHPSNSSSVKVYYQTGSSQDTSAATGATSAQGSQGELLADDGTESTALLKNFGFSPQTASPGKGPSMETTSQEALSLDSASDTISSKILSASASGDAGNQFTRDGQFQDNLFTLMRDGIIQTPAATTPSPGQATGSLSLGYATWPADLAQWIAQLHGRKSNYLTLELEPKHLGRVVVSVETDDNKVSATISTESENVRSLLSQGSTSLRQQLESMGLELSQLTINVGQNQNDQTSYRRSGTGGTRTKRSTQSGRQSGVVQDATAMALEQGSTNHLINVFV